jgi:hypothetical protein
MPTKAPAKRAKPKAPVKGKNSTGVPGAMKRIRRLETAAKHLQSMRMIYSYGGGRVGGHIAKPEAGEKWTDCSGCATYLLDVAGIRLKNDAGSTWSLAEEGSPGASEFFTLFIKNNPGDEHVICRLRKRPRPWHFGKTKYRWFECGGTDNPTAGGGPSFFTPGSGMGITPEERVKEFNIHRHFKELEA